MDQQTIDTLRMIAVRSEVVGHEAFKTLRAENSPILQARLNFVAKHAIGDPAARFTEEEKQRISLLFGE